MVVAYFIVGTLIGLYIYRTVFIKSATTHNCFLTWKEFTRYKHDSMTYFGTKINFDYNWFVLFYPIGFIRFCLWYVSKSIRLNYTKMVVSEKAKWNN